MVRARKTSTRITETAGLAAKASRNVGHPGGVPHRHRVQGHRDGPHVVLTEHQGEQPGELLQLQLGVPQQQGALLQPPR